MSKNFTVDNTWNIGWLDPAQPMTVGETPEAFREKLFAFCERASFNLAFGIHVCELPDCPNRDRNGFRTSRRGDVTLADGNGEIRVLGPDKIYAAPNMIYHYVVDHRYKPPQEFIDAVLACPSPASPVFWVRFARLEKVHFHP